jgi:hypothetical protein
MEARVKKKTEAGPGPRIVGQTRMTSITEVKPNTWNPSRMTPFMRSSIRQGLEQDGWLQSLLIWGTDERGKRRNVIIDGENRWAVGSEMGFRTVPMVFLDRLTEAQAKALTIKLGRKRGTSNPQRLGELLRGVQFELPEGNMALQLGIEQPDLMKLLAETPVPLPKPDVPPRVQRDDLDPDIPASGVRMVQLFFSGPQQKEFTGLVKELTARYGERDTTATVLEAVRRVHRASGIKRA